MVLAPLLIAGSATFSGGSVNDFVTSVAVATGKNVIAAVGETAVIPPITYSPASLKSLHEALGKSPLHTVGTRDVALSDGLYVGTHFRPLAPDLPEGAKAKDKFEKSILKNGKVTLDTSKWGPVHMAALSTVKWSQPISTDYLLRDLSLSIHVKDMPEPKFLQLVASAVGATLTLADYKYHFGYDDASLRNHVKKTLLQQKEEDHPTKRGAKRHLIIGLMDTVDQPELALRQQKEAMGLYPWVSADDYKGLVNRYIRDLRAADSTPGELTDKDRKVLDAFLSDKNQARLRPDMGEFQFNADGIAVVSFPLPSMIPNGYSRGMPAESI